MDFKLIFKTVVTIGIFIFLSFFVDVKRVLLEIIDASPLFLLLAIVFQFLSTLLASYRWNIIMNILGFKERFIFYFKSYFKGSFFNQLLPSNIGGDAVRLLDLKAKGYGLKESFFGIVIDRVFGILALV
ncbi:MAG: lysylphosphatidylglycerol synthase transmembrane domain-containing protein, partial [Campylobacterales bacterium]